MNNELSIAAIYRDEVEKEAMSPIVEEAEQRGYESVLTNDTNIQADVCLYSHNSLIDQGSKAGLTVIMFHSIDGPTSSSGHWRRRHWGKFDVGFVIGENTAKNWREASQWPQARPAHGVYNVGWPKSDFLFSEGFKSKVHEYKESRGMSNGKTVLYAPTSEGPGKIHDYMKSVNDIADNILIKHAPYEEGNYLENESLQEIYDLYGDMEDVYIIDKNLDVFIPLSLSDVLVSDESSVLQESLLTKTVPVSVTDWPIRNDPQPDFEKVPPFALRTSAEELSDTIETTFGNIDDQLSKIQSNRDYYFSNLGNSSRISLDVIESVIFNREPPIKPVEPKSTNTLSYSYNSAKFWTTRTIERKMPENLKGLLKSCKLGAVYNRLLRP